jgi:hypothetical protein
MEIAYDRASDPATIQLRLTDGGFGVVRFDYGYSGYSGGRGAFDYRFRSAAGDTLTVATSYGGAGFGRAAVTYLTQLGATGGFDQCWDAAACLTYVRDPANFSCPAPASCSFGTVAAGCPSVPDQVPLSPF